MAEDATGRGLHPIVWGSGLVFIGFLTLWLLLA